MHAIHNRGNRHNGQSWTDGFVERYSTLSHPPTKIHNQLLEHRMPNNAIFRQIVVARVQVLFTTHLKAMKTRIVTSGAGTMVRRAAFSYRSTFKKWMALKGEASSCGSQYVTMSQRSRMLSPRCSRALSRNTPVEWRRH